jgi:hypothetical protein
MPALSIALRTRSTWEKSKTPSFWFFRAPGRFCNAHDGDARLLHHAHVLVETVVGRIFVVIGRTEKDGRKGGSVRYNYRLRFAEALPRTAEKQG